MCPSYPQPRPFWFCQEGAGRLRLSTRLGVLPKPVSCWGGDRYDSPEALEAINDLYRNELRLIMKPLSALGEAPPQSPRGAWLNARIPRRGADLIEDLVFDRSGGIALVDCVDVFSHRCWAHLRSSPRREIGSRFGNTLHEGASRRMRTRSAGVSPAEGRARPLVAWAAERRETA